MAGRGADKVFSHRTSLLDVRGLIMMENARGMARSRELSPFPSGNQFPASPWAGAKVMLFHTLCVPALPLCCP